MEVLVVRDQDILNVVRVIEEKRLLRPNLEVSDISVARQVLKIRQRPAKIRKHIGERKCPFRTGRESALWGVRLLVNSHCGSDLKRIGVQPSNDLVTLAFVSGQKR